MAEKDITSKTLESYNDVFADIINVFLFGGNQIISPDDLSPADIFSQYKAEGNIHEQDRDVSKFWKGENQFIIAFLGIENQTTIHNYMPLRVISYDGAQYRKQLSSKNPKRIYPVITLVLYFGEDRWEKNTTLYECVDIPDYMIPYVNDYKINLFDMHNLNDKQIADFKSDFKQIALYYKALHDGTDYTATSDILKHPKEVTDFFSVFRKDNRFTEAYNELNNERNLKGDVNMCELLDKIEAKGFEKGEAKGFEKGEAAGIASFFEQLRSMGVDEEKLYEAVNAVKAQSHKRSNEHFAI